MKRRIFALGLALALLCSAAYAAGYIAPEYISAEDYGEPLRILQDYLGVTEIDPYSKEPWFGELTLTALEQFQYEYGLEATYEFDAQTLYALLDLPAQDEYSDPLVWIPMHGGARYHVDEFCSLMIEPQQMPETCAYALEFTPCLRCCY
ncbi:MAG: peptidoglycan-binding protein [Clostridia bacterium]|nr:peptidoglycan-binding protein [Clostridia bacterium]